jgi:hypothetical protein
LLILAYDDANSAGRKAEYAPADVRVGAANSTGQNGRAKASGMGCSSFHSPRMKGVSAYLAADWNYLQPDIQMLDLADAETFGLSTENHLTCWQKG